MTGNSEKNPFARGVDAERERIIGLLEHQEVWNSMDNKWVHPTYCLTCRNIQRIEGTYEEIGR